MSVARILTVLLFLFCGQATRADDSALPDEPEIWLVTYGSGEIYWQRFGHNAIWVRDKQLGLDHVFNFGFFDFAQENFLLRFVQGRMLYFSAARPAREEFSDYINENRSIRAQKLDLSAEQKLRLIEHLLEEVRPENRDYLYDYYENNCSTRVRDALDLALGGLLRQEFEPLAAGQNWRDHTRRLTAADFWLYLGLEIGLGPKVDQASSRWQEMFIPAMLAESIASIEFAGGGQRRPLVLDDVMLFESSNPAPPERVSAWWPRYLLLSLGFVLLVWLMDRYLISGLGRKLSVAWFALAGAAGVVLVALWLATDHAVASRNLNLLVFNPLWLVLLPGRVGSRLMMPAVVFFSALALLMVWLPPGQYTLDVLAAAVPLNLAAATALSRSRSQPATPPAVPA